MCFVTSWQNWRGCCAAGPAFSVGNSLKAKLEGMVTCMLQNLGSLLREIVEASSQSFRGCTCRVIVQNAHSLARRPFGSVVVVFASTKCKI